MSAVQTYGNVVASESWSLQDQIDQMQSLISLSIQDDKAFRAVSQKEIKDNENRIADLKGAINLTRNALSKITPEDDRILKTAFRHYPFEYRVVRYKTSEEAKDYMDDKVLQLHRETEKLQIQHHEDKCRVDQLKRTVESIRSFFGTANIGEYLAKVRELETDIIKVRIHFYAADLICHRYDSIINLLKKDEYCYSDLIEKLEMAAVHQSRELRDLKRVCIQAMNLRDTLKENMTTIEHDTLLIKRDRERLIKNLRKDAEKRTDVEVKKVAKPLEDYGDIFAIISQRDADNALLETFKKEVEVLLDASKVSDLKMFLTSWKFLLKGSHHLQKQLHLKEEFKERLQIEWDHLKNKLLQLQYTDSNPDPKGLLNIQINEKLVDDEQDLWMAIRIKHQVGSLVQNLKLGLQNLKDRLAVVHLLPKFQYGTTDDPHLNNLMHCDAVISQILERLEEEGGEENFREIVVAQQVTAKVEDLVQMDKIRIPIEEIPAVYEHEEAETYGLTREQVRAMGQALIDANTRKKRRKAKRRRR